MEASTAIVNVVADDAPLLNNMTAIVGFAQTPAVPLACSSKILSGSAKFPWC